MSYSLEEHQRKALHPTVLTESFDIKTKLNESNHIDLEESARGTTKKLVVQMEAIHTGRTANYTFYTKEGLSNGLQSWTNPYPKPVLTHHNDHDGEPIGRIVKAEYSDITPSGKGGLIFTCEITDPQAVEKVLDGRYRTVSIGATTDKVTCNICGTDRTQEWCDHFPGEKYEEQNCHFIVGTTMGREVSYVNVPADEFAQNFSVTLQEENNNENFHVERQGVQESAITDPVLLVQHVKEAAKSSTDESAERSMEMNEEKEKDLATEVEENSEQKDEASLEESSKEEEVLEEENKEEDLKESEEVAELKQKVSEQEEEIKSLKQKVAEKEEEIKGLLSENQSLIQQKHLHLAEKVVELKKQLKKPDILQKSVEESVKAHTSRSQQSLLDTMADLQEELKVTRPESGSVQNPGISNIEETDQKSKNIDKKEAENILKSFFGSKRK